MALRAPSFVRGMALGALPRTTELAYEGILTDFGGVVALDDAMFQKALDSHGDKSSAWLRLPVEHARFASDAAKRGFKIHHAEADHLVMYRWLREDAEDKVPPYASTQVGCAGFLVNENNELLVVKEWTTTKEGRRVPSAQWKLPGGLADRGESFLDCAARETFEETGVQCEPASLLGLWHRHSVRPWGLSDIYAVVRLEIKESNSQDFRLCPDEISDARWYPLSEFVEKEGHPLIDKLVAELYDANTGAGAPQAELLDVGVQFKGRERYATYLPTSSTSFAALDARRRITAIASDVDGTLLRPDSTMDPRNFDAIQRTPLHFFVATGKCRDGARKSLGLPDLNRGVFVNGLVVYDDQSNVIFERTLSSQAVDSVMKQVLELGDVSSEEEAAGKEIEFDVVAYCRDSLYSFGDCERPRVVELAERYQEPRPSRRRFDEDLLQINKLLVLGDPYAIASARPVFESALASVASVTQALPSMLEILPLGASKRLGVQAYCGHFGIDERTQLLAVGDGENDVDMLKHAAVGVAVGNAVPDLKQVADLIVEPNDQAGAARAIDIAHAFAVAPPLLKTLSAPGGGDER
mmetsp:Transcript_18068/g.58383  ORF Transcript_18068/g.58383 Transcript_18068/m.58383 type:complete len:582 (-) Transcript_18068:813-2558(-)